MPDRFTAYCLLLPVAGVLLGERAAAGWLWDWANGFGFAAFGGLIYLSLQGRKSNLQLTHKDFSYAVIVLLAAHVILLLLKDSLVLDYVLPGAPMYMWSGVLALLLLLFIVISAVPGYRKCSFYDGYAFRRWHKPLSWVLIACAAYHIVGTGFYIRTPLQYFAIALLLGPLFIPARFNDHVNITTYSPLGFLTAGVAASALLSVTLNWPQN
ncbi:MAG: hypothetical protein AAF542_10880 [Pseudomonadota bacterium]